MFGWAAVYGHILRRTVIFRRFVEWSRAKKRERQRRRTERLTAKAATLAEDESYDILFLHQKGFVQARATGQSITEIRGEVESLINKLLHVRIPAGTYFLAKGDYQNMVTTRDYTFTLFPCATKNVSIAAACINAGRPIPDDQARFYGVRRVSDDLQAFLEAAAGADAMTIQAGVWALTDAYSGADVQNHLYTEDRAGNRRPAVSERNVAEARHILDGLGLRHRL